MKVPMTHNPKKQKRWRVKIKITKNPKEDTIEPLDK